MKTAKQLLDDLPRGTRLNIARVIGISHSAVSQWSIVPLEYVSRIESELGIPRHKLRPDRFSEDGSWIVDAETPNQMEPAQ